jgi:hypothetical protein
MASGLGLNSRKTTRLRLAYSAPELDNSAIEELRRLTMAATKALPFVKLRANDQPLWRPECYWNVRPIGKKQLDLELGQAYARKAIAAMEADRNTALIGLIIQDIIHDAVVNRCGRLSHVALGFLNKISQAVAANAVSD